MKLKIKIIEDIIFTLTVIVITVAISTTIAHQNSKINEIENESVDIKYEINILTEKLLKYNKIFLEQKEKTEKMENELKNLYYCIEDKNNKCPDNDNIKYVDEENILTVIRLICDWRKFDYKIAYAVAIHESALNPNASNLNENGTRDHGLYQFNDITLEGYGINEEIAYNPYTATEYFILMINNMTEKYGFYDGLRAYAAGEWGMLNGGGSSFADDVMDMIEELINQCRQAIV